MNEVITNIRTFYSIAREAYIAMNTQMASSRKPKPDGAPGYILAHDPDQRSFKSAFITIVFCGVCLEALLHLLIVERKSLDAFKKIDRENYEKKLELLGCSDQIILSLCQSFRHARKELIHEKAYLDSGRLRIAQEEAGKAMDLLDQIFSFFKCSNKMSTSQGWTFPI